VDAQGSPGEAVRVLLADDHPLFRDGLREILEESGLAVVGMAGDGESALRLAIELVPDVVVMDLSMAGMDGIEATAAIADRVPTVGVLVLTVSAAEESVMDALLAGAMGYLLKDAPIERIVAAVHAAARGEATLSPRVAARLLERLRQRPRGPVGAGSEVAPAELSERELDVLRLLAQGMGNAEIAAQLYISPRTVKNHIASILAKLRVENRIQAAVYAVRVGII